MSRLLARELQATANATVTHWAEGAFQPGRGSIESLDNACRLADAAILVFTPDDLLLGTGRAVRSNLLLELGYLIGRLGRDRTFLVASADAGMPSDLAGMRILFYDHALGDKSSLRRVALEIGQHLLAIVPSEREDRYSCFITYAAQDRDFSLKLSKDLEADGFRCWLDAKDIPVRSNWRDTIGRAIEESDKAILVLSQASLQSRWVRDELQRVLDLESKRHSPFLIPLRLDNAVLESSDTITPELAKRQIADFRHWTEPEEYNQAFSHLIRSLMVSRAVESRRR